MDSETELLKRRFSDLDRSAHNNGYYEFSDFLSASEQAALKEITTLTSVALFGGFDNAERKLAIFGSPEELGYDAEIPITCLKISPINMKFADALSHRDFLGSLMGLGIKRSVLGDIIVYENEGYLFCIDSIADYIRENLEKVRHTNVKITEVETPPTESIALPEKSVFVTASERIDAFVASVYNLSRAESSRLFEKGFVAVDGKITDNTSLSPKENSIISVRGYGRFIYCGKCGDTRKGKIKIEVRVYN